MNSKANKTTSGMNGVSILKVTLIGATLAVSLSMGILALAGFWSIESPRHWRNATQSVFFFGARHAPKRFSASITGWALKINGVRTSYDELEESASLFEGSGQSKSAAAIWLALSRIDGASNNPGQAYHHALLSHSSSPNEKALEALVAYSKDVESRNKWSAELQINYPNNDLSGITLCLTQLQSLEDSVPSSCEQINWLLEKVTASKTEFEELKQQILDLPEVAQANVEKYENEVSERDANAGQYYLDVQAIEQKKSEVKAKAVLQALLPIPKDGDTPESYVVREGICLLPVIRWACIAISAGESAAEAQKELQQLDYQLQNVQELIRLNTELRRYAADQIEYWKSSQPFEELKEAKRNVLPKFQADVEKMIVEMRHSLGLSIEDAIYIATT